MKLTPDIKQELAAQIDRMERYAAIMWEEVSRKDRALKNSTAQREYNTALNQWFRHSNSIKGLRALLEEK
jgi:hypothetical protein